MTVRVIAMGIYGAAATLVYYLIWDYIYNSTFEHPYIGKGRVFLATVYFLVLMVSGVFIGGARIDELRKGEIVFYQIIALVFTNSIAYAQICLIEAEIANVLGMIYILLIQLVLAVVWSLLSSAIIHKIDPPEQMIIVYGSHYAEEIVVNMSKLEERYNILESVSVDSGLDKILNKISDFQSVIICDVPARMRNDILKECYKNGKRIYIVPKISDIIIRSASDITYFDSPIMSCLSTGLTLEQRAVKRFLDITLSSIALIICIPIFIIVPILIKLDSPGPAFYKQRRCSKDLKEFDIIKFRSMIADAEKYGARPATSGDPRITRVGKIIRKLRIDELPQLINILKGDMSIVGPRPERIEHVQKYSENIPEFVFRYKVKGGLTGYAQVFGKYNTSAYNKLKMDLIYIQNYSLALDFKLIIMTIKILFSKESTEGFRTEEDRNN